MLKFSMTLWTVDKDGKRYPGAAPIAFRLRTPIEDFRVSAPGFDRGYFWNVQSRLGMNVSQQMFSQATPIGPFAPLSDKPPGKGYASWKRKKYGEQAILMATGDLFLSFFEGADHVCEETAQNMKWGTTNPLAGYHFRGHTSPTPLPRRPLGMPPDDFGSMVQSDAARYVAARYRQEGFRVAKEAGVGLTRPQASQVGRMVLGGGYGALPIGQAAMGI